MTRYRISLSVGNGMSPNDDWQHCYIADSTVDDVTTAKRHARLLARMVFPIDAPDGEGWVKCKLREDDSALYKVRGTHGFALLYLHVMPPIPGLKL